MDEATGQGEVTFEPGEVKIFSIPTSGEPLGSTQEIYETGYHGIGIQSGLPGWDPFGFAPMIHSASSGADVFSFVGDTEANRSRRYLLTFGPTDGIAFGLYPEEPDGQRNVSIHSKVCGSAFNFWLTNKPYAQWRRPPSAEHFINYMFTSRAAGTVIPGGNRLDLNGAVIPFNLELISMGFPAGQSSIPPEPASEAIPGQAIINATSANETIPLLQFTLPAACEVSGANAGFANAARR